MLGSMIRQELHSVADLDELRTRLNARLANNGINSEITISEEPRSYPCIMLYHVYGRHGDEISYEYVCREDLDELQPEAG